MEYWYWLGLGLLCLIVEMLTPGVWFLWFGVAALGTGATVFVLPLPEPAQWILFAVLSVIFVLAGRRWYGNRNGGDNALNNRKQALLGRRIKLEEAIVDGEGTVNIDDTRWPVQGDDAPAGTVVEVVAVDGARLRVRPVT